MVRGMVQSKSKKSVSSKKKGKTSKRQASPKIHRKTNYKRKSTEESDSQTGIDDSKPEKSVKRSVGRPRKDANTKVSPTKKKSAGLPKKHKRRRESASSTNEETDEESSVGRRRKNANSKVSPSTKKKSVGRPIKHKHRSESSESTSFTDEKSSVGRLRKDANGKVSRSTKKKSVGRPKKRRASESESASFTDEERDEKSSVGRRRKDANGKVSRSTKKKSVGRPKKRRASESESASSTNEETDEESSVDRSKDDDNKESSERERSNRLHSNGSKLSSNKPSEVEDNYEVEDIMDFKIEDDKKYFLIRWKGYGPSVDSWEKERRLNCPDLIDKFYEKHPEARISSTKRKRKYDSDYEVSSSNSYDNYDASTIKRSVKRNGKNSTRVEDNSSSDEESESEADTEDLEPKVKRSVGRPKNAVVNVSSSTKHWIVGRPRKRAKSDDESEENYEVEEIIDFDIEDDIKYFLVRWKGYDSSVDSWEEHRSLNCPELIAKFYKEHPEAQVSAISKREYDSDDEVSSSGSEYELTDSEQLAIQGSVKKRFKKSTRNRKSRQETNVTSTVSDTDEPEPEVNEKKSVGRTRKEAMANVSSSPKKISAGRLKKH